MNYFQLNVHDSILHVQMARGEKYNALNVEMLNEFSELVEHLSERKESIVLLTGDATGFCAGGDISMMREVSNIEKYEEVMKAIESIVTGLYQLPKVVIAAIDGPAVGLGLSIALACDYVIASEGSTISMNFIGIGLAPDGGGHFWLEQRLGTHRAKQFAWNGFTIDGRKANELGIVDEVVANHAVDAGLEKAKAYGTRPIASMLATKKLYHDLHLETLLHVLVKERTNQWDLRQTYDHREGIEAFLEKRQPAFKGK